MLHIPQEISWLTVDEWQTYVESHPNSSIFHHRNWLELLHEQYGFEIRIPALMDNGKILAAIPLLQTRNLRGAKKLISLPFTDYLQILANDQPALEVLCLLIQDQFRGRFEAIVIRSNEPVPGADHESHIVRHELRTDSPLTEIESSFASAIKRNLNKGRRFQLEFQKSRDAAAMDIFYRLHVLTRRKLGVPVQSRSFFNRINNKLIKTGLGYVCIVTRRSVPISAGVMLGFNGRFVYKYAASDPAELEHRPNDWLVYNTIRIASEEGYRIFDFGISEKKQEGLRRFKSKWGATESDVFYSYIVGHPDQSGEQSSAMRLASEVIKRSPTVVCRAFGKAFYKYSQ